MNRYQTAQKLAEHVRAFLRSVGYEHEADHDVRIWTSEKTSSLGYGENPAVVCEIGGFAFTPYADSIEFEMDGLIIHDKTWKTPPGSHIENFYSYLAIVYKD